MIYKRCSKCGKRIPSGTSCPDCKREYRAAEGIYKHYHTQRWRKLRDAVIARYDGIDLWALHRCNRIEYAETVHHIIPSSDDESMFFTEDNLIPVSRTSHDEIHRLYKTQKEKTQQIMQDILKRKGEGESEKF